MKYIQGFIHLGVAGVHVRTVPGMTNMSFLHSVGVHYVRVGRNDMVLRYSDRDDFDGDQTHDLY